MSESEEKTYCGIGIRGVAIAIDSFVWIAFLFVAMFLVAALTGDLETGSGLNADLEGAPATAAFLLWFGLAIGYHTVLEWKYGKTVGKSLVGIRVTDTDGSLPTLRSSLVRNGLRLIDWLPFFYIVGIALLSTSDRASRLGDRFGNTVVVRS